MTCKDCFHREVCKFVDEYATKCTDFKDKSKIFVLVDVPGNKIFVEKFEYKTREGGEQNGNTK